MEPISSREYKFLQQYAGIAKQMGLDPNPDAPEHHYDYRAALAAGARPDETGHWPSEYKTDTHPNRFVTTEAGFIDSKTGRPYVPNEVSTITGKAPATPEEEFSSRVGLLSNLSDLYDQAEGTYGRDPRFVLGGIQKAPIPSKFAIKADAVRRGLYNTLAENYNRFRKELTEELFNPDISDEEWKGISNALTTIKQNFRDHIRGIKATPDTLLAKVKTFDPLVREEMAKTTGQWTPGTKKLGLNQIYDTRQYGPEYDQAMRDLVRNTPFHETTHTFQSTLYESLAKNKGAREVVKTLPKEYQKTVFNNELLWGHTRDWAETQIARSPGAEYKNTYRDWYYSWPSEKHAEISAKLKGKFVEENKRVPTMAEEFMIQKEAQDRVLSAWKRTAPKTYEQAREAAEWRIQNKYGIKYKFEE